MCETSQKTGQAIPNFLFLNPNVHILAAIGTSSPWNHFCIFGHHTRSAVQLGIVAGCGGLAFPGVTQTSLEELKVGTTTVFLADFFSLQNSSTGEIS